MSLERTTLNHEVVSGLLYQNYGISMISMIRLELGSANCFRIFDGSVYYFLKEFQSGFSEDKVIREANLLDHLSAAGIPTAHFYKTVTGEYTIQYQGHVICLEKYVEGQAYDYNDLPPELLGQVGAMLGKIHCALSDYPLPMSMDDRWISSYSADRLIAEFDNLIAAAGIWAEEKYKKQIVDDLQYRKKLAVRLENCKRYFADITYCSSHGDYQGCQLIFDGNAIKAVIDFSSASCLPVAWEIMRSFVQSYRPCIDDAKVDVVALCDYVREYMKHAPISKQDLIAMPYVYLFQLARSKFGYHQYLVSSSEEAERLLHFGFWRTKMCREIEMNAEAIGAELLKLLDDSIR